MSKRGIEERDAEEAAFADDEEQREESARTEKCEVDEDDRDTIGFRDGRVQMHGKLSEELKAAEKKAEEMQKAVEALTGMTVRLTMNTANTGATGFEAYEEGIDDDVEKAGATEMDAKKKE